MATRKPKLYKTTPPPPKQGRMGKQLREYRKKLKAFGGRK